MATVEQELRDALTRFMRAAAEKDREAVATALARVTELQQRLGRGRARDVAALSGAAKLSEGAGFSEFRHGPKPKRLSADIERTTGLPAVTAPGSTVPTIPDATMRPWRVGWQSR